MAGRTNLYYDLKNKAEKVWLVNASSPTLAREFLLSPDTSTLPSASGAPGILNYLTDVALNPRTGNAWVTSTKHNAESSSSKQHDQSARPMYTVINQQQGELQERRVDMDNHALPRAIAFSQSGLMVAIAHQGTNTLVLYDTVSELSIGSAVVDLAPRSILIDESLGRIYTLSLTERKVTVLDAREPLQSGNGPITRLGSIDIVTQAKSSAEEIRKRFLSDGVDFSD